MDEKAGSARFTIDWDSLDLDAIKHENLCFCGKTPCECSKVNMDCDYRYWIRVPEGCLEVMDERKGRK